MVLAVTYPWAPASSYLSSQSVADSRCNPHATPRSSYSRRSPSCRFFLCRAALGAHRGAERAGHRGSLSHRIRTRRHEGRLGLLFGAPLRIPRSRALSIHLTTHRRGLASGRAAGQG